MDRERVWEQVTGERRAVLELLEHLAPAEWEAPTLCAGWRARELVAHLTMPTRTGLLAATVGLARARFDVDRYFAEWAVEHGRAPTTELLQQWRDVVTSGRRPREGTPGGVLVETVAHAQDLRGTPGDPEVRGHGDDLLLAMLGRPEAVRDLSGTGVVRLVG